MEEDARIRAVADSLVPSIDALEAAAAASMVSAATAQVVLDLMKAQLSRQLEHTIERLQLQLSGMIFLRYFRGGSLI